MTCEVWALGTDCLLHIYYSFIVLISMNPALNSVYVLCLNIRETLMKANLLFCLLRASKTIDHRMVVLEDMGINICHSCFAGEETAEACGALILPNDDSDQIRSELMLSVPKSLNQSVS